MDNIYEDICSCMSENSCVCEGDDIDLLQSMIQTIHDEIGTLNANECPQRATISHILLNITYTDGRVVRSETTSNNTQVELINT